MNDVVYKAGVPRPFLWPLCCLLWLLLLLGGTTATAGDVTLTGRASLSAAEATLVGELHLVLHSQEAIYSSTLEVTGQSATIQLQGPAVWLPGEERVFDFKMPSRHSRPGRYQLLVAVRFLDQPGVANAVTMGFEYGVGGAAPLPAAKPMVEISTSGEITLKGARRAEQLAISTTGAPYWTPRIGLAASAPLRMQRLPGAAALESKGYAQLARVDWLEGELHQSQTVAWSYDPSSTVSVQRKGQVQVSHFKSWLSTWPASRWLYLAAIIALMGGLQGRWQPRGGARELPVPVGWGIVLLLSLWVASWLRPDLWFTDSWVTGGDVASHLLYAARMADWIWQGRVSGWMPEVFGGFAAFHFYFPLPFVLAALGAPSLGLPVAFKLVTVLPPVVTPLAAYTLARSLRWAQPAALLGVAASVGFLLTDGTSIWGGNMLATLAGEFAYGWGVVLTLLFWAALATTLQRGGRWWLLAALLEAAVALSHGYAILVAGFGAFLLPLVQGMGWRGIGWVLKTHTLAFLLIGFWMIPLIQNLPWTIPNDATVWVDDWRTLWPRSLWPIALGGLLLPWWIVRVPTARVALAFPLLLGCLALVGFASGGRLGLADIRFFPYAQWAFAFAAAGSMGWLLSRWSGGTAFSLALIALLLAWWSAVPGPATDWARWNLEGYQAKPLWPQYQAVAAATAGTLAEPRIAFEHDPANNDVGSTRALEALPLWGSRPVLEGLYMEAAITGPFIYQLQSEISARPSSPLARFPSTGGDADAAVRHMQELYADTLWLRSSEMKSRFGSDPRFEPLAAPDPFLLLRLRPELRSQFIEVLDLPLVPQARAGWLERAFTRFRAPHPYHEREVYLANNQQLPPLPGATTAAPAVELVDFQPERIEFKTHAVGRPHLLRMAYHPKWRAVTGEPLYLIEPAFILLFPQSEHVVLEFAPSWGDRLGAGFSLLGLVGLVWGWRRGATLLPNATPVAAWHILLLAVLLLGGASWGLLSSAERAYRRGHELFDAGEFQAASGRFLTAYHQRHVPAAQAEALFWAARAAERAGLNQQAMAWWGELIERYPGSYWLAESLYRRMRLLAAAGQTAEAAALRRRLREEFPQSRWSEAAEQPEG